MTQPVRTKLYIDGSWREPLHGRNYAIYNPARPNELVGYAASASPEDVNLAVEAAHKAFPEWSQLTFLERAEYLRKIVAGLKDNEEDIKKRSVLFTREHGKIFRETMLELSRLGERFSGVADFAERLDQDEHIAAPPFDTLIKQQPRGVAALIVPWNWPLSILGAKLPQALLAGNTCVIKPSANSPLTPALTIQIIADMLPPGVVNILTGSAGEIGDSLVSHPLVRKVNFTGSVAVGKHVMRTAAENLTAVTLELGGNDAGLFLEDAVLDEKAFQRMFLASFASSGQICMALKRLYVHESRYKEVVDGLTAICDQVVVGDGLLPETSMGPVNNARQLKVVTNMIEEARAKGANVRECGQVPDEGLYRGGGYFQKPTLVYDADPCLSVVREEQFGPVLPIMKFKNDNEAIAMANDSRFGLCSSVWTADPGRALRVAEKIEAGYTYLNDHGPRAQDSRAPFGGFKDSGIGRNLGYEGILSFTESHSISSPPGFLD